MKNKYCFQLLAGMLMLLLFFCCGLQRLDAAEKFDFNNMTDAQQRQIFSPQLVSADDIREGKIDQRKMNISQMMRGDSATGSEADAYIKRLANLEKQVYGGQNAVRRLRSKAGIMFSTAIPRHPAIDEVLPQVAQIFYQAGMVPVPTAQLQSVLNNYRYRNQLRDPLQISRFLAEYPGARYLFFLQAIVFPRLFPGHLHFSYYIADGVNGRMYPQISLDRAVRGPYDLVPALHSCFVEMINNAAGQMAAAPWEGKVFLVQGSLVYLSAGQYSGLVPGQRLLVNGALNPVRDQRTGIVVGSVPGPPKAQLQVQRFFGNDLAEAVIMGGGGVRIGDSVIPGPSTSR